MKKTYVILMLILLCLCFVACGNKDQAKSFTVNFANTGDSSIQSQTVESGKSATKPATPSKVGFRFIDWFTSADGKGEAFDFSTPISADITIFANWEALTFTVSFKETGDSSVPNQNIKYGEKAAKPQNPVRNGYSFVGWALSDGTEFDFEKTTITADTIIYATWKREYIVSFANTGVNSVAQQTVLDGNKAEKPSDPIKEGYSFLGWFTQEEGGEEFDFNTPIIKDIVLYAQWVEKVFKAMLIGSFNEWENESDYVLVSNEEEPNLYTLSIRFTTQVTAKVSTVYGTEYNMYGDAENRPFTLEADTIYKITFDTTDNTATATAYEYSSATYVNTAKWDKVYAYLWRGDIENSPYPGVLLDLVDDKCEFETTGYEFVIFSDGVTNMTDTLTLVNGESYCREGIYEEPKTIYFYNVDSWENVYVHLTDSEGNENASYPGIKLTFNEPKEGVAIDATGYDYVRFSDGNLLQTNAMAVKDESAYSCRGIYDESQWPPVNKINISFENDLNWTNVFVYLFGGSENSNAELELGEDGLYHIELTNTSNIYCNFNDGKPKGGQSTQRFRLIDGATYRGSDSTVKFEFSGSGFAIGNEVYIIEIINITTENHVTTLLVGSYDGTILSAWIPSTCIYNFVNFKDITNSITVYRCAEGTTTENFSNTVYLQKSVTLEYTSSEPICSYTIEWLR
ncbi:MAG: InlB B-repeat-containing protein [Clostridia bacterium]|nr:InlB B-repeat-containing protein [Clostridia bacterium]